MIEKGGLPECLSDYCQLAIKKQATDIHFHELDTQVKVFFREKGDLIYDGSLSKKDYGFLKNMIKLHAHMDVSQSILPQDGRLAYHHQSQRYDVRVASIPVLYGETMVLRFYITHQCAYQLEDLGFDDITQNYFKKALTLSSGLILVTGPTGSGKTTTLYALLNEWIKNKQGNVVTLEDPCEMVIANIRQTSINPKAGFGFYEGLKALLRQDPDVMMVGEIRDKKTAEVAVEAAYTGHLVLSTLHTDTVKNSILRLLYFGLDPFLIHYCLKMVVSQRLVKEEAALCQFNEEETVLTKEKRNPAHKILSGRRLKSQFFYNQDAFLLKKIEDVDSFLNDNIYVL